MATAKATQAPYQHSQRNVRTLMLEVTAALTPVLVVLCWMFGPGPLINVAITILCCLMIEAGCLTLRGQALRPYLTDGSALVTAVLLGLALPPLTPWWVIAIASLFAIGFAKHIYGGVGYNVFNPAMAGYAVVLISFPTAMSWWPDPSASSGLLETIRHLFTGEHAADAISGATPLDALRSGLRQMRTVPEMAADTTLSLAGRQGWLVINLTALAGGVFLLLRKTLSWHIPAGVVAGLAVPAAVGWVIDNSILLSPWLHLTSGGTMLGIFFIATDPVSSTSSPKGKLIYGCGIGLLTYVIRTWGAYPDGFAFAVLLMNLSAPLIDRYTLPRLYGTGSS